MHHSNLFCCFQIVCQFKSFPPAIDFRWTFTNQEDSVVKTEKNSKELQMSPNSIRHLKRPRKGMMEMNTNMSLSAPASAISTASLKYRADSRKDFGTVECFASNLVGESRRPCLFTIVPAGMHIVYDNDGIQTFLFYKNLCLNLGIEFQKKSEKNILRYGVSQTQTRLSSRVSRDSWVSVSVSYKPIYT